MARMLRLISSLVSDKNRSRRATGVGVMVILGLCLSMRMALAWRFFGFLTGDDVEILETGLRSVVDLGYQPWEIRNTLLPTLLVWPMGVLGQALGLSTPRMLAWIAVLPFAVFSTLSIVLLYRLAREMFADREVAVAAAVLLATHWIAVGFGSTVYPRTPATTCVLAAALVATRAGRRVSAAFLAGVLLALAFAMRYSEVVFVPPALALALAARGSTRSFERLAALFGGLFVGGAVFVGLPDWLEWGRPFSSLASSYNFTIVDRDASALVKDQPIYWYLWRGHRWTPPALLGAIAFLIRARPPLALVLYVACPVASLSLIHHKDLRYLQGVIPFICLLGGVGLARMWNAGWKRTAAILLVVSIAWSGINLRFLGRKSMAAVLAAEYLASRPDVRTVVAQQAWAFGDRLFFGHSITVRDLDFSATLGSLRGATRGADAVVIYEEWRSPAADEVLRGASLCFDRTIRWGRSRPVSVFRDCSLASGPTGEALRATSAGLGVRR